MPSLSSCWGSWWLVVDALPHSAASLKGDSCLARSGVGFWQAFSTYKIISLFILETKFNYCALNISPHVYCIYQFILIITLRRVFNYFCFYNITFRCGGVSSLLPQCESWGSNSGPRAGSKCPYHWAILLAHGVSCVNGGSGGLVINPRHSYQEERGTCYSNLGVDSISRSLSVLHVLWSGNCGFNPLKILK